MTLLGSKTLTSKHNRFDKQVIIGMNKMNKIPGIVLRLYSPTPGNPLPSSTHCEEQETLGCDLLTSLV